MKYRVIYIDCSYGKDGIELFFNYSRTLGSLDDARAYKQDIDKFVLTSFIIESEKNLFSTFKIVR